MVLETHMKLCVKFLPQKWGKCTKNRVFWIYWKIESLGFSEFSLWRNFIIFAVFLHKSHTWENSGSWDVGQNALNQSDCSIFKLTKWWKSQIFWVLMQIHRNLKLTEKYWRGPGWKQVWPLWSQDTKIGSISKSNQ